MGDRHRVLGVGGEAAVVGDDRPVVGQHLGVRRAHRDHRLDRQREPLDQPDAPARTAVVEHVGGLVHLGADAVAAVVVDDAVAARADVPFDRGADVGEPAAELGGRQAGPQRALTGLDHRENLGRDLADGDSDRRVAVPAVDDRAAVDRDDVALAQHPLAAGDRVDHLVVHRAADGRRVGRLRVTLERRDPAVGANRLLGQRVQVGGGDAGRDGLAQPGQGLGHQQAGHAHLGDLSRRLDLDVLSSRHALAPVCVRVLVRIPMLVPAGRPLAPIIAPAPGPSRVRRVGAPGWRLPHASRARGRPYQLSVGVVPQRVERAVGDVVHRAGGVDTDQDALLGVVRHERRRLVRVHLEPVAHGLGPVVVALEKLPATSVTDVLDRWRVEVEVPDVATVPAGSPPGQPPHDLVVVDDELEYDVETGSHPVEHLPEHLGLRHVAREAVEQEALHRVVLSEAVTDHADGDLIRDEVASVHEGLGLDAQFGSLSHVRSENVPGGDLGDGPRLGYERGLSTFSGTGRSHQYETHYRRKPS
ncbi:hypothetical protein FAGKG844_160039 [Frankia sp. AgKG'84/4]